MFVLENEETHLILSENNGAICDLMQNGKSLITTSDRAFHLRLLDDNGDTVLVDDRDFSEFSFDGDGILHWCGCDKFPRMEVTLKIRKAEHGSFRFRPSVTGIPAGHYLELIAAPLLGVPLAHDLLMPHSDGALFQLEKAIDEEWADHLSFPGYCDCYPGLKQMQFLAAYSDNGGVYLAADDLTHSIKFLGLAHKAGDKFFNAYIECCCGTDDHDAPVADYELPYDLIVRPFAGDWQHACEIYRQWVEQDPAMKRNFTLPDWLDESPVVIIYPVRGGKSISNDPNRFLPYENAFPRIKELAEQLNSKVMVLLMRWDHNGPWLPPYYWPPVGGAESFRKFRDLLHGEGHLLGVYGSGTHFTRKSLTNDYSGEEIYQREHLEDSMVRGPKGEIERGLGGIREGTAFCITEDACYRIMAEQTMILADEQVDFYQILDQNLGGAPLYCYSKEHHHSPVPGRAATDAMRKFLRDLNDQIRARGSNMILGTECAAAGPFVADMPFNDLRANFIETKYASPIHAYSYVFHRYLNNFFGNCCNVPNHTDEDCFRYRMARGFIGGSMMTIVLRDSGEIDWGASVCDWSEPVPNQKNTITLVRNMNVARQRYPEFLQKGDMIPAPCIECGTRVFPTLSRYRDDKSGPEILCSAWRAPDGRKAAFFVNYMTEEKTFRWLGKDYTVPPLDVMMVEIS